MSKPTLPKMLGYQAFIRTVYHGPTDTRGSHIVATNQGSGRRVSVSWDDALDQMENHMNAACALYRKCGQPVPAGLVMTTAKDNRGFFITAAVSE